MHLASIFRLHVAFREPHGSFGGQGWAFLSYEDTAIRGEMVQLHVAREVIHARHQDEEMEVVRLVVMYPG